MRYALGKCAYEIRGRCSDNDSDVATAAAAAVTATTHDISDTRHQGALTHAGQGGAENPRVLGVTLPRRTAEHGRQ